MDHSSHHALDPASTSFECFNPLVPMPLENAYPSIQLYIDNTTCKYSVYITLTILIKMFLN